ncbi:hypothetical protein ACWC10_34590, partial [Streptomyces sp. NPDC001595]
LQGVVDAAVRRIELGAEEPEVVAEVVRTVKRAHTGVDEPAGPPPSPRGPVAERPDRAESEAAG